MNEIDPRYTDIRLIGHRGWARKFPENSVLGFQKVLLRIKADEKVVGFELDLSSTKDCRVAVFHDRDTRRLLGFPGELQNLTFEEISEKIIIHSIHKDERAPSYEDILDQFQGKLEIFTEIKYRKYDDRRYLDKIIELINAHGSEQHSVHSSSIEAVLYIKKHLPGIKAGILIKKQEDFNGLTDNDLSSLDRLYPEHGLDKTLLQQCVKSGKPLYPWTIDTLTELDAFLDKTGISSELHIITNDLDILNAPE